MWHAHVACSALVWEARNAAAGQLRVQELILGITGHAPGSIFLLGAWI